MKTIIIIPITNFKRKKKFNKQIINIHTYLYANNTWLTNIVVRLGGQ